VPTAATMLPGVLSGFAPRTTIQPESGVLAIGLNSKTMRAGGTSMASCDRNDWANLHPRHGKTKQESTLGGRMQVGCNPTALFPGLARGVGATPRGLFDSVPSTPLSDCTNVVRGISHTSDRTCGKREGIREEKIGRWARVPIFSIAIHSSHSGTGIMKRDRCPPILSVPPPGGAKCGTSLVVVSSSGLHPCVCSAPRRGWPPISM
jgi:hypothetical protein